MTGANPDARTRAFRFLTWADRLVLYVVVGAALLLLLVPAGGEGVAVHIVGEGGFDTSVPLDADDTLEVAGPLGVTVVEVRDGAARIVSSPCPQKLCVSMGAVGSPGRAAVCVPNRVVVTVEGDGDAGPGHGRAPTDAVTR